MPKNKKKASEKATMNQFFKLIRLFSKKLATIMSKKASKMRPAKRILPTSKGDNLMASVRKSIIIPLKKYIIKSLENPRLA
ncbi:hypothetical protein BI362_11040 [Streptococcus parauberis]|nr:hypothetical protein BI362_11040 [Streptococcus parauberis]